MRAASRQQVEAEVALIDAIPDECTAELVEFGDLDAGDLPVCPHCGRVEFADVLEYWPAERAWLLNTCCEVSYELWLEDMAHWSRHQWRRFFWLRAGVEVRNVVPPHAGAVGYVLDFGVRVGPVDLKTAKQFVRDNHRHNPPPVSWRWGHGAYNGDELVAVAMVGRPVARMIDHTRVVEVNRLCVNHDLPPGVVYNACSSLYAAAAREAKARGFERAITYTLESESGVALKAAGWHQEAMTKGGSWHRASRPRTDKAPTCRKVRWGRELVPARRRQAAA